MSRPSASDSLSASDPPVIVATFYKFVSLGDAKRWQSRLRRQCEQTDIKGTILLASEGLNATVAGSAQAIERLVELLRSDDRFADMKIKRSQYQRRPFQRLKVRLKNEIVTIGDATVDPIRTVGTYVDVSEWNRLLDDPNVTVIDTRNEFEVSIGTFDNAVDPKTKSFRDFTAFVDEQLSPEANSKVALFCTGGIRCEKATSYMLDQGFQEVYHLEGGILSYLAEVEKEQSRWSGECFVFDERVTVTHGVAPGSFRYCETCGDPFNEQDKISRDFESGLSCSTCRDARVKSER